jgi:hypothetical protein
LRGKLARPAEMVLDRLPQAAEFCRRHGTC